MIVGADGHVGGSQTPGGDSGCLLPPLSPYYATVVQVQVVDDGPPPRVVPACPIRL